MVLVDTGHLAHPCGRVMEVPYHCTESGAVKRGREEESWGGRGVGKEKKN